MFGFFKRLLNNFIQQQGGIYEFKNPLRSLMLLPKIYVADGALQFFFDVQSNS